MRPRVEALAGTVASVVAPADDGPAVAVPPRRSPPVVPRLADPPLAPPQDTDELLDRLAVALERGDDPDEIELLLDGISRLRDDDVHEGRARAVLERALALSPIWEGQIGFHHARDAIAVVLVRWLGGPEHRRVQLGRAGRSPREAIGFRVRELVDDLTGGEPRKLLSAPTHRGGWVHPLEAVERVRRLGRGRPPVMDLAQLALRLAPDNRDEARAAAAELPGEAGGVLLRALGGDATRPSLSELKVAWAAAEHARHPAGFVIPQRPLADHEAYRASVFRRDDRKIPPASPADLLVLEGSWWGWEAGGIERWLADVWPANREGACHFVVRRLWINDGTREYGIEDVLEVLLDPLEPIGDQAVLATALALGSADIMHRALATDVAIAALHSRRLDGATLGATFAFMLRRQEEAVPARWASSLTDVAAAGPLAAHGPRVAVIARPRLEDHLGARLLPLRRRDWRRSRCSRSRTLRRSARSPSTPTCTPSARAARSATGFPAPRSWWSRSIAAV